jgi:hypothetical protein
VGFTIASVRDDDHTKVRGLLIDKTDGNVLILPAMALTRPFGGQWRTLFAPGFVRGFISVEKNLFDLDILGLYFSEGFEASTNIWLSTGMFLESGAAALNVLMYA